MKILGFLSYLISHQQAKKFLLDYVSIIFKINKLRVQESQTKLIQFIYILWK